MIELFDDYVIAVDQYNYTFGRRCMKKNKDGELAESVRPISYHNTLAQALQGARRYFIRGKLSDGCASLSDALSTVLEVDAQFEKFIQDNIPDV